MVGGYPATGTGVDELTLWLSVMSWTMWETLSLGLIGGFGHNI